MQRKIYLIALAALAVVGIACGAGSPSSSNDSGNRGGAGGGGGDAPVATLNQAVRDGDLEFVVTKVDCTLTSIGPKDFGVKAQGVFCLVSLSAKNIGNKAATFSDTSQKAFAGDVEYSTSSSAGIYLEDNKVWLTEINPGNKVTGAIVFDVPKGTKLTKLELHDSPFSGGVTVNL